MVGRSRIRHSDGGGAVAGLAALVSPWRGKDFGAARTPKGGVVSGALDGESIFVDGSVMRLRLLIGFVAITSS